MGLRQSRKQETSAIQVSAEEDCGNHYEFTLPTTPFPAVAVSSPPAEWLTTRQSWGFLASSYAIERVTCLQRVSSLSIFPPDLLQIVCVYLAPCSLDTFLHRFQITKYAKSTTFASSYSDRQEVEDRIHHRVLQGLDVMMGQVTAAVAEEHRSLIRVFLELKEQQRKPYDDAVDSDNEVGGRLRRLMSAVLWHRFAPFTYSEAHPCMPGEVLGQLVTGHYFFAKDPNPHFFGGTTHNHFVYLVGQTLPELLSQMHPDDVRSFQRLEQVWEPVSEQRCQTEHKYRFKGKEHRAYCQCASDRDKVRAAREKFGADADDILASGQLRVVTTRVGGVWMQ